MSRTTILVLLLVVLGLGIFTGRHTAGPKTDATSPDAPSTREILYWVAPMDPDFRRDGPGKSPMGMDLVPVYADEVGADGTSIDSRVLNNMGVRTAPAQRSSLPRLVETAAEVGWNEATLAHVHTRVDGWVESLKVAAEGDPVSVGELLFELYSPTLVNAQTEYLAALAGGNTGLERASRDRLAALGMAADEIARLARDRTVRQRVRFTAQADGIVAMLGVREGMFVTPSTDMLSIAALDSVWVHAYVLERQAEWVEPGQRAIVVVDALPGERFETTVDYVYPELDPVSRTLKLRLRLDNAGRRLTPNMLARVSIEGRETGPIVHVPREAVIRGGRGNRVVVALGNGRFESRRVLVGLESGERIAIRSGLAEGESVVVSGQFLIDSESNVDQALSRFGAGE